MPELGAHASAALLPTTTKMGPVHLSVTDFARAMPIWRDVVGLRVVAEEKSTYTLGVDDDPLVVLHLGASGPVMQNSTGLYHLAIHVPERRDLASFVARAAEAGLRIAPTDHLVTEAVYAWDPDGHGIEITFETPWRGTLGNPDPNAYGTTKEGKPHSGREALDLDDLMSELAGITSVDRQMPAGTRIGHVHVHVTDLRAAMGFYRDVIGFGGLFILDQWGMGDAGLDYPPHAIAFNIWAGTGARPPAETAARLQWFSIQVPDLETRNGVESRLRAAGCEVTHKGSELATADPSGNRLRIGIAGNGN